MPSAEHHQVRHNVVWDSSAPWYNTTWIEHYLQPSGIFPQSRLEGKDHSGPKYLKAISNSNTHVHSQLLLLVAHQQGCRKRCEITFLLLDRSYQNGVSNRTFIEFWQQSWIISHHEPVIAELMLEEDDKDKLWCWIPCPGNKIRFLQPCTLTNSHTDVPLHLYMQLLRSLCQRCFLLWHRYSRRRSTLPPFSR